MYQRKIASKETIFIATHFSHNGVLLHEELEARLEPYGFLRRARWRVLGAYGHAAFCPRFVTAYLNRIVVPPEEE